MGLPMPPKKSPPLPEWVKNLKNGDVLVRRGNGKRYVVQDSVSRMLNLVEVGKSGPPNLIMRVVVAAAYELCQASINRDKAKKALGL